ncbi:MAG: molybdopterin molybdotransferase MoeA [Chromatiales bacterium]|jgi:molybdopterin molybdotransferase|nr:molybdopterin molybdotransferase MoeA [Chromatiales bacterium]
MRKLITVEEAESQVRDVVADFGTEQVPIADCAGRILRQSVSAERDLPPFDRVMMDGIAIDHASWRSGRRDFLIRGEAPAGKPRLSLTDPGGCIEVMTGAVLPDGCNSVIPVERIALIDDHARLETGYQPKAEQFIHKGGSDHRSGSRLLDPGTRLTGPEAAIAAAAGLSRLTVSTLPEIGVVSIGDELVEPGETVLDHQIRRSNDYGIEAAIRSRQAGTVTRVFVNDDRDNMLRVIGERLEISGALVLSGGVSMGRYDHVPDVLEALGIQLIFHKVSQRPGRPMWFGCSRDGKPVFALPGNPVSAIVCLSRYVLPALESGMGLGEQPARWASLADDVSFTPELTLFLPVRIRSTSDATLVAEPRSPNTSGDFASLAGTDGFVELPRGQQEFSSGFVARFWPW